MSGNHYYYYYFSNICVVIMKNPYLMAVFDYCDTSLLAETTDFPEKY